MSSAGLFGATPVAPTAPTESQAPSSSSIAISSTSTSSHHKPSIEIPAYDEIFPYISIHSSIRGHLSRLSSLSQSSISEEFGALIGQQLIAYTSCNNQSTKESIGSTLLHCNPLLDLPSSKHKIFAPPDPTLRNKLRSNPFIELRGKLTGMTPEILQEIFAIADDLQISEVSAISLYAEASDGRTRKWLEERINQSFVETASAPVEAYYDNLASKKNKTKMKTHRHVNTGAFKLGNDVPKAARELFFHERSCLISTLLILIKERIAVVDQLVEQNQNDNNHSQPSQAVIHVTDELLQNKLIPNLISCIKGLTEVSYKKINDINASRSAHNPSMVPSGTLFYGQSSIASDQTKHKEVSDMVLLSFALSQRQSAADCLFYLLYQTQTTGEEVTSLLDLVKELSNAEQLRVLDPLKDVPSIQLEPLDQQQQQQGFGWVGGRKIVLRDERSVIQEKDAREWENELIQELWNQGKPQLMHCISVLTLAVMCALDSSQLLFDRNIHGPNVFGVGNALFPPSHSGLPPCKSLNNIHTILEINVASPQWKRKDIWALLCAAFALLLQPNESSATDTTNDSFFSPGTLGNSAVSSTTVFDVQGTFHYCLEMAPTNKAFTFARTCILPSIGQITSPLNPSSTFNTNTSSDYAYGEDITNFEFFSRVLADFTNSYLETVATYGEMPISREKWRIEEEEELQLRRLQEEQRMQFGLQPNSTSESINNREVDFDKRPDCMDDLIALVVEICSFCPSCATRFWELEETEEGEEIGLVQLRPSRALIKMESLQKEDNSLLPAYLSLLAALSLAGTDDSFTSISGANTVHSILSLDSHDNSGDSQSLITWQFLLIALQWYADQLCVARATQRVSTSSSYTVTNQGSSSLGFDSTSYYYGANEENDMSNNSSSFMYNTFPQQAQQTEKSVNADLKRPTKPTLGENNTLALLSILALISRITSLSDDSRKYINCLSVPSNTGKEQNEDVINILFKLLTTSLCSSIKGEVFNALAALVKGDKEIASKGWDLLEASQVVPTILLGQYSSSLKVPGSNNISISASSRDFSSTRHTTTNKEFFTSGEHYGILYEMEHIESMHGSYPATEGLLFFLNALISSAGIKPNLGANFRRPGIAPYIEYIVSFVIPRTMSLTESNALNNTSASKYTPLPFASPADRSRLMARALEVISAVICAYIIPPPPDQNTVSPAQKSLPPTLEAVQLHHNAMMQSAELFGLAFHGGSVDLSSNEHINFEDVEASVRDFKEEWVSIPLLSSNDMYHSQVAMSDQRATGTRTVSVPRPKSPGFALLSDILSGGQILKYILLILVENNGSFGIHSLGEEWRAKAQAYSLFVDSKPSFNSLKEYFLQKNSAYNLSSSTPTTPRSLVPPVLYQVIRNHSDYETNFCSPNDPILWRERALTLSLRILCAAAAREESFAKSVNASNIPLTVVPVLWFDSVSRSPTQRAGLNAHTVSVSRLSNTLIAAAGSTPFNSTPNMEPLPIIAQYVGYQSYEDELAIRAVGVLSYVAKSVSSKICVPALCGKSKDGPKHLAQAFARKLLTSHDPLKKNTFPDGDQEITYSNKGGVRGVILDLVLSNLGSSQPNLSQILLGLHTNIFASPIADATRNKGQADISVSSNCLDAILQLLSDDFFLLNPESAILAARAYQIIYYLCSSNAGSKNSTSTMLKLRKENFWVNQCRKYFAATISQGESVSIIEIVCLAGADNVDPVVKHRNNHVMHAFAWLLKGVALELHSLMGVDFSQNSLENLRPQPTQCRKLLEFLFDSPETQSIISGIMLSLPLGDIEGSTQSSLIRNKSPPPREVIKASKRPLPGPFEVCGKYEVIDLHILSTLMQNENDEKKVAALEWGKNWNSYVSFVCSSSHLGTAWGLLVDTIAVSCDPIIVRGYGVEGTFNGQKRLLGRDGVVDLIISILQRFNQSNHHNPNAHIEPGIALPLSVAALRLVQLFIEFDQYDSTIENNMTDVANVCFLIASCIASCAKAGSAHDERAVILSSALVALFDWINANSRKEFSFPLSNKAWKETFLHAAIHLSRLAVNDNKKSNTHAMSNKSNSIALAAREGLASMICFFEDVANPDPSSLSRYDENSQPNNFLLRLFEGHDGENRLSALIGLVPTLEADIAWTLLSVAQSKYGTELLFHAGLPAALLTVANHDDHDMMNDPGNLSLERESYGSIEINPPPYLFGHVTLLCTMISAQDDNRRLAAEAAKFIRHHLSTFDRLLRNYPRNGDLTEKFLMLLSLIASALQVESNYMQASPVNGNLIERTFDKDLLLIEHRVEDFVFHISSFPFPTDFLSPLPTKLVELEQQKLDRSYKYQKTVENSWWGRLPHNETQSTISLPNPPLNCSSTSGDTLFGSMDRSIENGWSEEKYTFAISAASSLESALIFLKHRLKSSNRMILSSAGISLAKGIFRCADLANAINEYLISSSTSNNAKANFDGSQHLKRIEQDALSILGPILGRCAQSLLIVSSLHFNSLLRNRQSASNSKTLKSMNDALHDFTSSIGAVLGCLQIEQMGIGCVQSHHSVMNISRSLRERIQSL